MAKKQMREKLADQLVATVNGVAVYLSDRTQRDINKYSSNPAVMAVVREQKIKDAINTEVGRQKYLGRRDDLRIIVTDRGFAATNGTGTGSGSIWSKKQLALLLTPEGQKIVADCLAAMPDEPFSDEQTEQRKSAREATQASSPSAQDVIVTDPLQVAGSIKA